jgi:hypothetical protein
VKGTGLTGEKTATKGDERFRGEDHVVVAAGLPCTLRVSAVAESQPSVVVVGERVVLLLIHPLRHRRRWEGSS